MTATEFVWCVIGFLAGWVWVHIFGTRDYMAEARRKGKLPPGF